MTAKDRKTITDKVVGQIKSGKLRMKPRWYFVALAIAASAGLAAVAIVVVYLANLLVFKLRIESSGRPMYGLGDNISYFAGNFPWVALLAGIVGIAALIWMVKKFDFSYRLGKWTVIAVVLASLIAGSALAFTNINSHLENFGPMRHFYGENMQRGEGGGMRQQQNGKSMQQYNGSGGQSSGQGQPNMMQQNHSGQ